MSREPGDFDVIIVGYGPTGLTLAALLGRLGHRVAVVERWPRLYGLPRLTHIDGETARLIFLATGGEQALREAWTTPHYHWLNGKGQLLMDVAQGNSRRMIWDDHISVHQPHIEDALHESILAMPRVTVWSGYLATDLVQSNGRVALTIQPWKKGQDPRQSSADRTTIRSRYLVGADGSNSFVRTSIGVERIDFGFNERWLCVDTTPKRPLPERFNENSVQICDPRRGYMFMPIGRRRQRFEFALLPHETTEDMSRTESAWALLRQYHGLEPEDLTFLRNLVYTFECRLAPVWRVGNVFLAGDACHTNPPYLGQGACSGMRDASNLAWKFDLVLQGLAGESLLDSYQHERLPHARTLMKQSRSLGLVANTANPVKAALRDLMFRFKLAPVPKFPVLRGGILQRDTDGKLSRNAGSVPGQGHVVQNGLRQHFDQVAGYGFALLLRPAAAAALAPSERDAWRSLGVKLLVLDGQAPDGCVGVVDADGVYQALLTELAADAVLLRPDFVLYGHAVTAELPGLLHGLLGQLRGAQPATNPPPQ